ncbi:MAG: hypothetical protein ACKO4T_04195 [Planctomycetaceae bacterium]
MARRDPEPTSSQGRKAAVVVGVVALVVGIAAWWFWPRATLVPETAALAKDLLDAGGQPDRKAIRQLVANVDKMPRDQLFELWRSVGEEWRRLRQQAIDRYFTAPAAEKPQLLDAEIDRLKALRELMLALNPQADPDEPPRMPRERGRGRGDDANAAPADEAARKAEADRRAIADRYEEALVARAKSRGVTLPTFR